MHAILAADGGPDWLKLFWLIEAPAFEHPHPMQGGNEDVLLLNAIKFKEGVDE